MRKSMSILFSSTMIVVGLAAGVTPAHATTTPETSIGLAFILENFVGTPGTMESQAKCKPIKLAGGEPARSAANTSTSSTITLYEFGTNNGFCLTQVAVLRPGESDTGYVPGTGERSALSTKGALYYSST